jgi:alkaline phosphatase D
VLGQQTLFGQRDFRAGPGQSFWNDGWDGYPAARARMVASMRRSALANPVLFGGDLHQNWVGHVKADYGDPGSPAIGVEFCGYQHQRTLGRRAGQNAAREESALHLRRRRASAATASPSSTPKRLSTSLRVVNDVTVKDTTIETLARFSVEADDRL